MILPADIAEIYDKLDFEVAYYIHLIFEDELAADILVELEDDLREQLIEKLSCVLGCKNSGLIRSSDSFLKKCRNSICNTLICRIYFQYKN